MSQHDLLTPQEIDRIALRVLELTREERARSEGQPLRPWMEQFLRDLKRTTASRAIQLSPYGRDSVYRYRQTCPAFRRQWERIAAAKRARRPTSSTR